ncbi:hypothetical protein MJK72_16595 [Klebsiella pneumoniae]|nr:hypothetical protein MJK72_16595 [Klebsiella pneumoniae]
MTDLLVEIEGQGDPQSSVSPSGIRIFDEHDPDARSSGRRPLTAANDRGEIFTLRGATDPRINARRARPGDLTQRLIAGNIAIRYGVKAYFAAKVTGHWEPNKQGAMPDGQPGATQTGENNGCLQNNTLPLAVQNKTSFRLAAAQGAGRRQLGGLLRYRRDSGNAICPQPVAGHAADHPVCAGDGGLHSAFGAL